MPETLQIERVPLAMPESEADTCRRFVLPELYAAGWTDDQISEQYTFTDGRVIPNPRRIRRGKQKRADYRLRYTRDFPIAVVEAKASHRTAGDGLQQAKDYAKILDLKFAYATNGTEIIEFDFLTGLERIVAAFPTPEELWSRLRAGRCLTDDRAALQFLTPCYHQPEKQLRYYQQIAINRVVEAILRGQTSCAAHDGDRHGQDPRGVPDMLEALERPAGTGRGSRTGSRESSTSPTATSSSMTPRTKTSSPSAMPGGRSPAARSVRAGRCTSPSTRRLPRTSAARGSTAGIRPTSSTSSSWTSATGAAPATRAVGGKSWSISSPPSSSA